jgi:hypothetical protein
MSAKPLLLLWLLALASPMAECSYGGHDLFTSLSQLHSLWQNEQVPFFKYEWYC